jgi:hypothetical protein
VINKVVRLDASEFREEAVARVEARWAPNLHGVHTVNTAAGISIIDVLVRRRRIGN